MRHFNKSISSGDMRPAYATDRRLVVSNPVRGPSQRAAGDLVITPDAVDAALSGGSSPLGRALSGQTLTEAAIYLI